VSALSIDTERARAIGSALIRDGDAYSDIAFEFRALCDEMQITTYAVVARRSIETAVDELWRAGAFLHLVCDRVDSNDRIDPVVAARCLELADGIAGVAGLAGWLRSFWVGASGLDGEIGGTYGRELRTPYTIFGSDDAERARALLIRALADTADSHQIRADEFEIVSVGGDSYIVVLPGVTDLSNPDIGLGDNRTVRDLDQYAVPSSKSTKVSDNRYAHMVWEGINAAGVPPGANLLIVGHSFGSDTALDLAADSGFNGPGGYQVTHVVAAGYYSQPQLEHVPTSTSVLVLQNHRDAAVIVEGAGQSNAAATIESAADYYGDLLSGDLLGAFGSGWETLGNGVGTVVDTGSFLWDHHDDIGDVWAGAATFDLGRIADGASDLVTLDPRLEVDGNTIVDVFEGGAQGVGHHPSNYIAHLEVDDSDELTAFLGSVAASGYARSGSAVAVDISVPR
jgi:hypothetical protein